MQSVGDPSRCAAGAVQLSPRPFVPQQCGAARKADLLKLLFSSAADEGEVWERVPSLRETAGRGGVGGSPFILLLLLLVITAFARCCGAGSQSMGLCHP